MTGEEQSPQTTPESGIDPLVLPEFNDDDVLSQLKQFTTVTFGKEETDQDFISAMKRKFPMPAAYLYGVRSKDKLAVDIITQDDGYISCEAATVISWYWLKNKHPDIHVIIPTHRIPRYTHAFTIGMEHFNSPISLERLQEINTQIQLYKCFQPMDQSVGIHLFDLTENGGFGFPVRDELPDAGILTSSPRDVTLATLDDEWKLFTTIEGFVKYIRNDSALRIREKRTK